MILCCISLLVTVAPAQWLVASSGTRRSYCILGNLLNRILLGPIYRLFSVKYLEFLRKRMNTNPSRGPYHFRAPSKIFWRTVRGTAEDSNNCNKYFVKFYIVYHNVWIVIMCLMQMVASCSVKPQNFNTHISKNREYTVNGILEVILYLLYVVIILWFCF